MARVAALAQSYVKGNPTQHGHIRAEPRGEFLGHPSPTPHAKEIDGLTAVRAGETAHVLNDAHDTLVRLAREHAGADSHVGRSRLRSCDDNNLGAGQQLTRGDRNVSGAGRQIQKEHVQIPPPDVGEELLEGPMEHGSPERHRLRAAPGLERQDRDSAYAEGLGRHDHALDNGGSGGQAEESGHGVAVDVRVDDSDGVALGGHRHREVDGHGGLAHASLAGRDRVHVGA